MLTSGKIQRAIQRFTDYASDLTGSDMNTFDDRLNLFMSFCETDEVFSVVHRQLLSVPVDFEKWFAECQASEGGMAGSGELSFPAEIEPRMTLMYQLLRRIWKENRSLAVVDYAHPFFVTGSSRLDSYISAFNDAVTEPLCRELGYRLDEISETLPEDRRAEVPIASIQIIHHAHNVIQQNAVGSDISQSAVQKVSNELTELFERLRSTATEAAPPEEKADVAATVDAVKELATSTNPKIPVIKRLFKALPATASVLSITAAILKILGV